jgi:hypothetical protein
MADITNGAQVVTAAGPIPGALSTSALSAIPTLQLKVTGLSHGATARIAIEDTASAIAFSDAQAAVVFDVKDLEEGDDDRSVTPDCIPSLRIGAANNRLRANVLYLTPGASVTLHAFTDETLRLSPYARMGIMTGISYAEASVDNSQATSAQKEAAQALTAAAAAFLSAFSD